MSHGKLYMLEGSPPVRAVLMTEKALGINTEKIQLNILEGDQMKPEYVKMNPQHTVPFYIDADGTKIADSQAIIIYIVSKYAKNDSLYPKDSAKQSTVNHRLFYNSCDVFALLRSIVKPILMKQSTGPNEQQVETANAVYEVLNAFLEANEWMAADNVTIADISLIATVTSLEILCPINIKNTKLVNWIKKCQQLPFYEANVAGLEIFKKFVKG